MPNKRIATLETEILVIDAQLESLGRRDGEIRRVLIETKKMQKAIAAERGVLTARRDELEAQKQPINCLPNELLILVFEFFAPNPNDNVFTALEDHRTLVNLTHTCSKFRTLAVSTSNLWSLIHFPCTGWDEDRVSTLLERSGDTPLDVVFGGQECSSLTAPLCTPLSRKLTKFRDILLDNLHRLRYLSVDCVAVDIIAVVVELLLQWRMGRSKKDSRLRRLSSLSLAITRDVPYPGSFPGAQRALSEFSDITEQPGSLKHLRLERIPLLSLPPHFYTSLTTLEISFAKSPLPNSLPLRYIIALLSVSRQLVHFSLSFNILTRDTTEIDSIILPCLKQIDLTCGQSIALPRFFSHINAPFLERLEVWLSPNPIYTPSQPETFKKENLHLASLKELSLQFLNQDSEILSSSIRHFTFPVLKKLEIVNIDPSVRDDTAPDRSGEYRRLRLPPLHKFESFFRDPRFPLLTHLTLSHFEIEEDKVDPLLGYIPALTSLSLDNVKNCLLLLLSLTYKATRVAPGRAQGWGWTTELVDTNDQNVPRPQGRMKFCPQLEALSFWGCNLDITILLNMVKARNDSSQENAIDTGPYTVLPFSASLQSSQFSFSYGKQPSNVTVLPAHRVIKPLRKTKVASQAESQNGRSRPDQESSLPSGATVGTTVSPSQISYLRIAGCRGVSEASAGQLNQLVKDVVWSKM